MSTISEGSHAGASWTRGLESDWRNFWFKPTDPLPVCALRAGVGAMAFFFVLSHSLDLIRWFGPNGILTIGVVQQLTGADQQAVFRPSYFFLIDQPVGLWALHVLGLAVTLMMAVGFQSRWTTPLSLAVVLSYVHRGPMISGQLEPVLCFSLLYLSFAPTGAKFSIDAWRRTPAERNAPRWTANFSLRMLQVHLAALYLLMAATKLASTTWWQGDAVWWLAAYSESRLVDLTGVLHRPYLFSAMSHLVVASEVSMGALVWYGNIRPVLLTVSAVVWCTLAALTGLVAFCMLMLILNMAFAPLPWHRRVSMA